MTIEQLTNQINSGKFNFTVHNQRVPETSLYTTQEACVGTASSIVGDAFGKVLSGGKAPDLLYCLHGSIKQACQTQSPPRAASVTYAFLSGPHSMAVAIFFNQSIHSAILDILKNQITIARGENQYNIQVK